MNIMLATLWRASHRNIWSNDFITGVKELSVSSSIIIGPLLEVACVITVTNSDGYGNFIKGFNNLEFITLPNNNRKKQDNISPKRIVHPPK